MLLFKKILFSEDNEEVGNSLKGLFIKPDKHLKWTQTDSYLQAELKQDKGRD